jgi:hypothetical protein
MTGFFSSDADQMMAAAGKLDEAAELAETKMTEFESPSFIPTSAYGGQSVPVEVATVFSKWQFSGRLADLVEGPYNTARSYMLATLSRTAVVLRANADELMVAAQHYQLQEQFNVWDIKKSGE